MAANAGPDIIEDGIVFYYDTGNTIKSYIGEPTTNYYNSFSPAMPNLSGGNVTTDLPDGTTGTAFRVNVNSNSNTSRCVLNHNLPQPIPQANVRYTISHWIRTISSVPVAAGWEAEVGASDGYSRPSFESGYIGDYGSFTQPNTITSTWTRVSYTFYYTTTKTSALVPFIYFGSPLGGSGDSIGASIDFYGFQIEVNPHVTQYTPSSRSATQGLLDMVRTSTINIANASFDNNAQIEFDGTNDYTDSGYDLSWNNTNSVSIEFMIKPYNLSGGGIMGKEYPNWEWAFYQSGTNLNLVYWNNAGGHSNGMDFQVNVFPTANTWYHITYTWDTTTSIFYVNGTAAGSKVAVDPSINQNRSNNVMIGGHTYVWADSYFNGKLDLVKYYNKALTASEVLTNYNALKTRFGI
jgi:hypothetical protein